MLSKLLVFRKELQKTCAFLDSGTLFFAGGVRSLQKTGNLQTAEKTHLEPGQYWSWIMVTVCSFSLVQAKGDPHATDTLRPATRRSTTPETEHWVCHWVCACTNCLGDQKAQLTCHLGDQQQRFCSCL